MLCKYYERHNNLYWYFHHCISQVVDYDVQFKESGTQYTEKIKVDTDKQTELFKVPAHNDVDGSNILHDFKAVSLFLSYSRRHSCRRTLESKKKKKKKNEEDNGNNWLMCSVLSWRVLWGALYTMEAKVFPLSVIAGVIFLKSIKSTGIFDILIKF